VVLGTAALWKVNCTMRKIEQALRMFEKDPGANGQGEGASATSAVQ
jgi:hypothetical protein